MRDDSFQAQCAVFERNLRGITAYTDENVLPKGYTFTISLTLAFIVVPSSSIETDEIFESY